MSDEIDQAPVEDTPELEATPDTAEVDWQKRYEDLRPEYDRSRQTISKFESDPTAVVEFIQQHHPDLLTEDDEPDLEDDEETTPQEAPKPDPRVDWLVQQQMDQRWERDLTKNVGERELSDFGRNILDQARQAGAIKNEDDLKKAVTDWFTYEDSLRPPEPEEKKQKRVPHTLTGGQTATGVKDFSDMSRDQIDQWMVDEVRARTTQS